MANRYVDFVSDKDFLECVKWVCDAYPADPTKVDMEELQRNTLDPFKMVFDLSNSSSSVKEWIKTENIRQQDKTINNKIGEFHQKLLGKVDGWQDLGTGDDSRVDLRKEDNTIFIELKNKFNTMNADATKECRNKLELAIRKHPKATAYWAYIISLNGSSGESTWTFAKDDNPRIRKIWGARVYKLVTGDANALEKTWHALPKAVHDLTRRDIHFSTSEVKAFFQTAFKN